MKIHLNSTDQFAEIDRTRTRIWHGYTGSGTPVIAFIVRLAVARDQDTSEFEAELQESEPPDVQGLSDALAGLDAMRTAARENGFEA